MSQRRKKRRLLQTCVTFFIEQYVTTRCQRTYTNRCPRRRSPGGSFLFSACSSVSDTAVAKALIWLRFPMYLSRQVPQQQISMYRSRSVRLRRCELSFLRAPLISPETKQYLRDQLVHLTEQFSSLTLASTGRIMRDIYAHSLETFIIEKRNLTSLVDEMADYTNRAIMKKLEAIRNLVSISEQSYRRFAETDQETRNATFKFMAVRTIMSFCDVLTV